MVATSKLNQHLDEVFKRRSEILPELADLGSESVADSVAWLERISRPARRTNPAAIGASCCASDLEWP